MSKLDAGALRGTLAAIKANPQHWDQRMWASKRGCGTSYCFAGWACVLSGIDEDDLDWGPSFSDRDEAAVLRSGESISEVAADILGLTRYQASRLFDGTNSLTTLERLVESFIKEDERASARQ